MENNNSEQIFTEKVKQIYDIYERKFHNERTMLMGLFNSSQIISYALMIGIAFLLNWLTGLNLKWSFVLLFVTITFFVQVVAYTLFSYLKRKSAFSDAYFESVSELMLASTILGNDDEEDKEE